MSTYRIHIRGLAPLYPRTDTGEILRVVVGDALIWIRGIHMAFRFQSELQANVDLLRARSSVHL